MNRKNTKTYRIAIIGILAAIIFIQNFVPMLGYLPIPPLNPTIIHITVIIAALTLGTKDGMIIGGVWGVTRFVKAFVMPASPLDLLLFTNPFISILPRILVGLIAGASYYALKKKMNDTSSMALASILGSLTNTILVLIFIYIFNRGEYAEAMGVSVAGLAKVLGTVVLTNGIAEAVAAAIIAPFIAKALKRIGR